MDDRKTYFNLYIERLKKSILEDKKDGTRTKLVLGIFREMGEKRKFEVYPNPNSNPKVKEFLVDLSWMNESEDQEKVWMELALESEWGPHGDDFQHDFYKLITAKAKTKVLIYRERKDDRRDVVELVSKEISRSLFSSSLTDSYLLIGHKKLPNDCEEIWGDLIDWKGRSTGLGSPITINMKNIE